MACSLFGVVIPVCLARSLQALIGCQRIDFELPDGIMVKHKESIPGASGFPTSRNNESATPSPVGFLSEGPRLAVRFSWHPPEGPPDRRDWELIINGALCRCVGTRRAGESVLFPPDSCDVQLTCTNGWWNVDVRNLVPPNGKQVDVETGDLVKELVRRLWVRGKPVRAQRSRHPRRSTSHRRLASFRHHQFHWNRFATELSRINTFQEAVELVHKAPSSNHPSNRYYVNLSVLVHTYAVPDDATWGERELYIELIRRWKENSPNLFMPGTLERLERSLLALPE